jgi:pimeloyl-ACP methyl ester carboxylesterase
MAAILTPPPPPRDIAIARGRQFTNAVTSKRLILIPGMGADERLFGPQAAGGLTFDVSPLPIPEKRDDLPTYAARLARLMDIDSNCIVGGVSFGGMVACEIARLVRPIAVFQIASCRSRTALPSYYTAVEWFSRMIPDQLIRMRAEASSRMLAALESLTPEQEELVRDMSLKVEVPFLRRVGRMIVRWKGAEEIPCPVHSIHGAKDLIIPLRHVQADEVIPDGGHMINLTHAERVNAFIQHHLDALTAQN